MTFENRRLKPDYVSHKYLAIDPLSIGKITNNAITQNEDYSLIVNNNIQLWEKITDKPTEFPPTSHTHDDSSLESIDWTKILNKPDTYPPSSHTHDDSSLESIDWTKILNKPATFPPSAHTHTRSEITDFFDSPFWENIPDKPLTFPPSAHTHVKSDITDFEHTHLSSDITDLTTYLHSQLKTNNLLASNIKYPDNSCRHVLIATFNSALKYVDGTSTSQVFAQTDYTGRMSTWNWSFIIPISLIKSVCYDWTPSNDLTLIFTGLWKVTGGTGTLGIRVYLSDLSNYSEITVASTTSTSAVTFSNGVTLSGSTYSSYWTSFGLHIRLWLQMSDSSYDFFIPSLTVYAKPSL